MIGDMIPFEIEGEQVPTLNWRGMCKYLGAEFNLRGPSKLGRSENGRGSSEALSNIPQTTTKDDAAEGIYGAEMVLLFIAPEDHSWGIESD